MKETYCTHLAYCISQAAQAVCWFSVVENSASSQSWISNLSKSNQHQYIDIFLQLLILWAGCDVSPKGHILSLVSVFSFSNPRTLSSTLLLDANSIILFSVLRNQIKAVCPQNIVNLLTEASTSKLETYYFLVLKKVWTLQVQHLQKHLWKRWKKEVKTRSHCDFKLQLND